jgi:hypothetical protein
MGLFEEISLALHWVPYYLSDEDVAAMARFDEAFGPPAWATSLTSLVDGLDDDGLRAFGRWVQLRLWLGNDGGRDYDERLLEAVRFIADADLAWTVEDARLLWNIANTLAMRLHTNYPVLYRIPLAAAARMNYADRRRLLGPFQARGRYKAAWEVIGDQVEALLTEPGGDPAARVRNIIWTSTRSPACSPTSSAPGSGRSPCCRCCGTGLRPPRRNRANGGSAGPGGCSSPRRPG